MTDFWAGGDVYAEAYPIQGWVDGTRTGSQPGMIALSGINLPDGRGMLVWLYGNDYGGSVNGSVLRGAYTETPDQFFTNDIITPADWVAWDPTIYYKAGVKLFTDHTDVYYSIYYRLVYGVNGVVDGSGSSLVYNEIWKADNPNDPLAGFSFHGTISAPTTVAWGDGYLEADSEDTPAMGIPYINGNRWVYVGAHAIQGGGPPTQAGELQRIWYSNDAGATWTWTGIQDGNQVYRQHHAVSIGQIPDTGYLYTFTGQSSVSSSGNLWQSQDDGATWTSLYYWNYFADGSTTDNLFPNLKPLGPGSGSSLWVIQRTNDYIRVALIDPHVLTKVEMLRINDRQHVRYYKASGADCSNSAFPTMIGGPTVDTQRVYCFDRGKVWVYLSPFQIDEIAMY